jgi:hypothetical protein
MSHFLSDAADASDVGSLSLNSAIYIIRFVVLGDALPPAPWPSCGVDPTLDRLGCESFPACPPSSDQSPLSLDDQFVKITEQCPSFGGMYFDEGGVLNFVLTNTSAVNMEKAIKAVSDVLGSDRVIGQQIRAVQGDYNFSELQVARIAARNLLGRPGVNRLDVQEVTNRVTIGLESMEMQEEIEGHPSLPV